ncbi:TspO/MBR family protein [Natronorubrum sp. DTA28]|uniref:TspO/MBR family protein n=1 Tax=Natronorubrum sp. DTA28 TaxID=3447019 RepID=UPI003F85FF06
MAVTTHRRSVRDHQMGDERYQLALAIAFCELVGIVPGILTADDIREWYPTLDKPSSTPPDRVFGPVWGVLFALMGVSLHLIRREETTAQTRRAKGLFVLQLTLNAIWSFVFFGRRSTRGGFLVILLLGPAIAATIAAFARVNRRAAFLLVPYLVWIGFATYLNFEIWRRNR